MTANAVPQARTGWTVVAGLLLVMAICHGIITSGLPTLDGKLLAELHISRADLKLRESIFLLSSGVSGLGIGLLTTRISPRTIVLCGLVLLSAVLALYGHARTIGQLYALYALLGMCYASAHVVIVVLMVRQYFVARRALAISIALSGTSIGAAIFPTLAVMSLEHYDWRHVLTGLAVLPLVALPIVAVLLPRVEPAKDALGTAATAPDRRQSRFAIAMLLVATFGTFFASTAILLNLFLYLQDIGLSARVTASGISTVFVIGLFGKIAVGMAAERWGVYRVWSVQQVVLLAGAAVLTLALPGLAFVGLVLLGLGWAGCYVLTQVVIADVFAGARLGRIAGLFIVFEAISSGSGVWSAAALSDRYGSYQPAFALCCALLVIAIAATFLFRRAVRVPA